MKRKAWLAVVASLAMPCGALAVDSENAFESRYRKSISTPSGKNYEGAATLAFWGDIKFMRECAPPKAPKPDPLRIYVEIRPDGRVGQLLIVPKTKVADCIARHARTKRFPKPPGPYVLKIDLKFAG